MKKFNIWVNPPQGMSRCRKLKSISKFKSTTMTDVELFVVSKRKSETASWIDLK